MNIFWSVLMERSVQQEAVLALLDVAMTAGQVGATKIGLPYTRTDMARNRIVQAFRRSATSPDDVLVMLDCDHAHPSDVIPRLAADIGSENLGIVAGLAFRRSHPHDPLWYVRQADGRLLNPAVFEPGLYRCDAVGTGAIAIQRWVFDRLVEVHQEPFYFFKYEYCDGELSPSEDIYFCSLCEKASIPCHVDCSLVLPHLRIEQVAGDTWAAYLAGHPNLVTEVIQ